eukprot:298286-Chlamydomonas_euryale.AAC.3
MAGLACLTWPDALNRILEQQPDLCDSGVPDAVLYSCAGMPPWLQWTTRLIATFRVCVVGWAVSQVCPTATGRRTVELHEPHKRAAKDIQTHPHEDNQLMRSNV